MPSLGSMDDETLVTLMIAHQEALTNAIERRIARQLDAIFHHPTFQSLERAWRGLAFVVDRSDFAENIQIAILSCSRDELGADLDRTESITNTGFYHIVCRAELQRAGGEPYGAIIADYEFGPDSVAVALLKKCSAVAYLGLAPFVAAASPRFFGVERWSDVTLPLIREHVAAGHDPMHQALRETEAARAAGLTLPRFLLRAPFRAVCIAERFLYEEAVTDDESYCWGNASFAFATRLTDSFARYRWCPSIVGLHGGGHVDGLPVRPFGDGADAMTIATEVPLSDEQEGLLAGHGFVPLSAGGADEGACFRSASSLQASKYYGESEEGLAAAINHELGTRFPYIFILARLAQNVMMTYGSNEHPSAAPDEIENDLDGWVARYAIDPDVPVQRSHTRRFLRRVKVCVTDGVPDEGHRFELLLRPRFKYQGSFFTLRIAGALVRTPREPSLMVSSNS